MVGNYPCSSATLAAQVPESVYADVDDCSVVLEFEIGAPSVSSVTVQLRVERPV